MPANAEDEIVYVANRKVIGKDVPVNELIRGKVMGEGRTRSQRGC